MGNTDVTKPRHAGHLETLHKAAFHAVSLRWSASQNLRRLQKIILIHSTCTWDFTQKEFATSQKDTKARRSLKCHTQNCPPCTDHRVLQLPPLAGGTGQYCGWNNQILSLKQRLRVWVEGFFPKLNVDFSKAELSMATVNTQGIHLFFPWHFHQGANHISHTVTFPLM